MKIIPGNLLDRFDDNEFDAIAHVSNCQCRMRGGIALSIKEWYPAAFDAYIASMNSYQVEDRLGTISFNEETTGTIFNLHAQFESGRERRHLNYEAFYSCLVQMRMEMLFNGSGKLGIPMNIGCDRAGGSWNIVSAMFEDIFLDTGITVTAVDLSGNFVNV